MSLRITPIAVLVGLPCVILTGCATADPGPQPEKVKEAVQSLGGSPETVLQQSILVKKMTDKDYVNEILFLVPSQEKKTFHIVDTRGGVYSDYEDFLTDNSLAE